MSEQLLLVHDFPPMGGGIARWMGELARRSPPGSLVVSTGQYPGSEETDRLLRSPIDRLPIPGGWIYRTDRGVVFVPDKAQEISHMDTGAVG